MNTACPCLNTTPCHPDCSCCVKGSSHGCTRCCSYGSLLQRAARGEFLAKAIDSAYAKLERAGLQRKVTQGGQVVYVQSGKQAAKRVETTEPT